MRTAAADAPSALSPNLIPTLHFPLHTASYSSHEGTLSTRAHGVGRGRKTGVAKRACPGKNVEAGSALPAAVPGDPFLRRKARMSCCSHRESGVGALLPSLISPALAPGA